MVRDYADMLWSTYNTYCKTEYDKLNCPPSKYLNPNIHNRSNELFHQIIESNYNKSLINNPFYDELFKPCSSADSYYNNFINNNLINNNLLNFSVILSLELLELNPFEIIKSLSNYFPLNINNLSYKNFSHYNDKTNLEHLYFINNKYDKFAIKNYMPTLYEVSQYQSIFPHTRELLNICWKNDCLLLQKYGLYYKACSNNSNINNDFIY